MGLVRIVTLLVTRVLWQSRVLLEILLGVLLLYGLSLTGVPVGGI